MRKRYRDDEIWKELAYFYKNPPTEEEEAEYKRQQDAWVQDRLNYIFDNDLLKGGVQKTVGTPPPRTPYDEVQNNPNLTKEEKVAKISEISDSINKEVDKEHFWKQAKNYGGAVLEIGAAALPMGIAKGAKVATDIANTIAPKVGRKIANEIGIGTVKGGMSGAVEGLGHGLREDENLFGSTLKGGAMGTLGGAASGSLGGYAERGIKGSTLSKYGDIDELNSLDRKQYDMRARNYYKDYIQETKFDNIPDSSAVNSSIDFSGRGIQEVLRWNPKFAKNLPQLKNDIKVAGNPIQEANRDIKKINTDHFDVYRGKLGDHYVRVEKDGSRHYYTTKDSSEIIPKQQTPENLNPTKPPSFGDWLDELKKKRIKNGF